MPVCMYVCIYVCMYVSNNVYTKMFLLLILCLQPVKPEMLKDLKEMQREGSIYVYMYVCMYVCMYVINVSTIYILFAATNRRTDTKSK